MPNNRNNCCLQPWLDKVKAVIVQFLPGEQAGTALAATIFGDAVRVRCFVSDTHRPIPEGLGRRQDPAGRLPLSFPKTEDQTWLTTPEQYPGVRTGLTKNVATYTEELLMGVQHLGAPLPRDGKGLEPSGPVFWLTSGPLFCTGYRWFDAMQQEPIFEFGDHPSAHLLPPHRRCR